MVYYGTEKFMGKVSGEVYDGDGKKFVIDKAMGVKYDKHCNIL